MNAITNTVKRFPGRLGTAWEIVLWCVGRRRRFKVTNVSMLPTLQPGDYVLAQPAAYASRLPYPGELVLAQHPQTQQTIVKRVLRHIEDEIWLSSDNQIAGKDSQHFGTINRDALIGRVTVLVK